MEEVEVYKGVLNLHVGNKIAKKVSFKSPFQAVVELNDARGPIT